MSRQQATLTFPDQQSEQIETLIAKLREAHLHVVPGSWLTEDYALTDEQIRAALKGAGT